VADRRGGCCTRATLIVIYMEWLLTRANETTLANYRRESIIRAVDGNMNVIRYLSIAKAALALPE
jgi:hypothetical protein